MNRSGFLKLTLAALVCLPAALRAEFVSIPTILNVHGLDVTKISCDPGSVQNAFHNEVCYLAGQGFSMIPNPGYADSYLNYNLGELCGPGCAQMTAYTWGGGIGNSRAAVDGLKEEILRLGRSAKEKGAPFIMIAHSWGAVLTAEALKELEGDGSGEDLVVDKLITLGSPLSGKLYSLALGTLISGQNFYETPARAASVKRWVNYYASRDKISAYCPLADENVRIDAEAGKYSDLEDRVRLMAGAAIPAAMEDVKNFSVSTETQVWHAAYFQRQSVYLDSVQECLDINAVTANAADYFRP